MISHLESQQKENKIDISVYKGKNMYFSGIGGSSMSGLAAICDSLGYKVSGSDKATSPFIDYLKKSGINAIVGQSAENIHDVDILIYSAAIKPDHPERERARELGIPEMERSVLLGQISKHYDNCVCIAGCHGKTTTTSMLGLIAIKAGLDPTIHVGGLVPFLEGGVRVGKSELFISEACEYVESFMTFHPDAISISNIDNDHLDYFRDIDHIVQTFKNFVELMPKNKPLYLCTDDPRVAEFAEIYKDKYKIISYGFKGGDYTAKITKTVGFKSEYDVFYRGEKILDAVLNVPGEHNVLNSLCAIAIARDIGAADDAILEALSEYRLVARRFEYYGDVDGVAIYHDYSHHPSEIKVCLQTAREIAKKKLYVVFQCNSYTRAKTLFLGDLDCFDGADEVLVPDIYPGREIDKGEVHARDMVDAIIRSGVKAHYIPTFEEISDYLHSVWEEGDVVITLGSGDVYIQTRKLM